MNEQMHPTDVKKGLNSHPGFVPKPIAIGPFAD
jgi:hypothetical protein